jgi:prepilin-type N-terminal cleavage/methylation domain-containing protein
MRKGFTLIELMIVVAIIAIIAAIAIPSLLSAMKSGRETSGLASVKAVQSANAMYKRNNSVYGTIDLLAGAGNLPTVFTEGMVKDDFTITTDGGAGTVAYQSTYRVYAIPSSTSSGDVSWASDESCTIYIDKTAAAAGHGTDITAAPWEVYGIAP